MILNKDIKNLFTEIAYLKLKFFFFGVFLFFLITNISNAQEIDFGQYSSAYSLTLSELNPSEDLDFGTIIQSQGLTNIDITNAKVLTLEGVKYLDVLLDITADDYLLLNGDLGCETDPSCRIAFTLQAAYANRGDNDTNEAYNMTVLSNIASAQFQILQRESGPPGPPPTPVYEGYNPSLFNETAYIYIFGSINVGSVDAGSYSGQIMVTLNYD